MRVLDAVVPPAEVGERGLLQLLLGEGALAASIGTPRPKNEASPFFTARRQLRGRLPRMRFSIALVETLELDVGGELQRVVPAQAGWSICR